MINRIPGPRPLRAALKIVFAFSLAAGLTHCKREPAAMKTTVAQNVATQKILYQCPMHPQIIRDHPGVCPICGMTLVPLREAGEDGSGHTHDSGAEAVPARAAVRIDPATARKIGLRTERVSRRNLASEIRLDGKVVPEENRVKSVTARVAGFVEALRASVTGQSVRVGETLLELYSPDLAAAQGELLQALRGRATLPADADSGLRADAEGLIASARNRLRNWGVPENAVAGVERAGIARRTLPLVAPLSGVVLRKSILEGQGVQPGQELFQIADLSSLWVVARLNPGDLAQVRVGNKALLRFPSLPGRDFETSLFFIAPEMDAATRTVEARFRVRNTPALDLKPEMIASVVLRGHPATAALAMPEQAVLRSGARELAVVSLGEGRFEPREIRTGRSAGGYVEVLEGLREGDGIVVSAQFLIDSESNLRAAVEQLRASGDGHAH